MSEPSWPLQAALYAALVGNPALTQFVGGRIYDDVPRDESGNPNALKPYISIGEDQIIADKADCLDGAEVFLTIHAWSAYHGHKENKQIAARVKDALDGADLPLDGHRLTDIEFDGARYLLDQDGLTRHAVITFRALTEATGA